MVGSHDLPGYAADAMRRLFDNEELLRAQLAGGLATEVRARRKADRTGQIRAAIAERAKSPEQAARATAVFLALVRAETGFALAEQGMTPEEVAEATRWAVDALLKAL